MTEVSQPTLDGLDLVDEVYEGLWARLEQIEREATDGQIDPTAAMQRRSEAFQDLGQHVMGLPGSFLQPVGEIEPELFPSGLFLPAEAPPSWVTADRRYGLEWIGPDVPGLGQSKAASAASGRMHVVNLVRSDVTTAGGWAQAAVGIRVRPTYALSRLTLRPELSYTWRYLMDTPIVASTVPYSQTRTRGRLRLIAQQENLASGAFETYVQRSVDLWEQWHSGSSARFEDSASGSFPGGDPGLSFIGSSATNFALWLVSEAFVSRTDFDPDPARRSICHATLDVEMPMMWLDEVKL